MIIIIAGFYFYGKVLVVSLFYNQELIKWVGGLFMPGGNKGDEMKQLRILNA